MAKEFLKIWFSDIETAHDFFDKNDKHLGEFLVNVYRSYAEFPTSFRCKHVEKYFKTYRKQIDFIKKAKADGMKAHLQEPETEDFSTPTLEGGVKGVVEAPLPATLPAKGEKIKGEKEIEKEKRKIMYESCSFGLDIEYVWETWIAYKKAEHKDTYKSVETEKIALEQLYKNAKGDILQAKEMIEYSMGNRYKGIFANNSTVTSPLPSPSHPKRTPIPSNYQQAHHYYSACERDGVRPVRWDDDKPLTDEELDEEFKRIKYGKYGMYGKYAK